MDGQKPLAEEVQASFREIMSALEALPDDFSLRGSVLDLARQTMATEIMERQNKRRYAECETVVQKMP